MNCVGENATICMYILDLAFFRCNSHRNGSLVYTKRVSGAVISTVVGIESDPTEL